MPRTTWELTWHPSRNCWKKKRHGKIYYLGRKQCKGKSDRQGYQLALLEWHQILAEVETAEAVATNATPDDDPLFSDPSDWGGVNADFANYAKHLASIKDVPSVAKMGDTSVAGLIGSFVERRRGEFESGQISIDSYKEAKFKLAEFQQYAQVEGIKEVAHVDAACLEKYKQCQLMLTRLADSDPDKVGLVTAKKRVDRLCQFLRWCHSIEALDKLPRNIGQVGRITLAAPRPQFFTVDECRKLYSKATERTKCLMALALNCGFRQTDIATLQKAHVDLDKGLIVRPRSKTGTDTSFKLWPLTVRLMKAHQSGPETPLFFIGEGGQPLVTGKVKEDGIPSSTDAIKLAFNRLKKQAGFTDPRGFAVFRKTSANLLNEQFQREPHIIDRFLGHTLAAMRKHYTREFDDAYFSAIDWLGEKINLEGGAE